MNIYSFLFTSHHLTLQTFNSPKSVQEELCPHLQEKNWKVPWNVHTHARTLSEQEVHCWDSTLPFPLHSPYFPDTVCGFNKEAKIIFRSILLTVIAQPEFWLSLFLLWLFLSPLRESLCDVENKNSQSLLLNGVNNEKACLWPIFSWSIWRVLPHTDCILNPEHFHHFTVHIFP